MTKIVRSFGSWDGENTKTCFASYQGPIFLSLSPYSVITPSYLNSLFCVCHCLSVPFSNWIFRTLYLLQWLSCYFTFVSAPYLGTCLSLCVSFCPSTSFLLVVLCFWISHFNSNNPFNSYILVILIYFLISVPLFRSFLFCSFVQFESLLFILSHSNQCDQIWRNFTTLVRRFNTLAIKKRLVYYLTTFRTYFDIYYLVLGKCSVLQIAKYWTNKLIVWSHWLQPTNLSFSKVYNPWHTTTVYISKFGYEFKGENFLSRLCCFETSLSIRFLKKAFQNIAT